MSTLIIQSATNGHEPLLQFAEPYHRAYCDLHGFDYAPSYVLPDGLDGRPPVWAKIVLIRKALAEGYDFVAWLDADTLIVRPELELPFGQFGYGYVGMCENRNGVDPWHLNAGVIITKNRPWTGEFWQTVWERETTDHLFQEQQALNEELEERNWSPLAILHPRWNSSHVNPVIAPVIRAWHGLGTLEYRLAMMKEAADANHE